jgi:hypothetical protein
MTVGDPALQQLARDVHALALVRDVLLDPLVRGGEALQVFGEHEGRIRDRLADSLGGERDRLRLVHDRARERRVVEECVRVPGRVERGEACGGERLVDRGPALHPPEAARGRRRVLGEQTRKLRIGQLRVERAAAVVQERDDRLDAALGERAQPPRSPAVVAHVGVVRRDLLPQHRVARRANSQAREQLDVALARFVAGVAQLIARAHPVDARERRLGRGPDLGQRCTLHRAL